MVGKDEVVVRERGHGAGNKLGWVTRLLGLSLSCVTFGGGSKIEGRGVIYGP